MSGGIIYDYEDGGSYCGEWEGDTSHGFGVCTGPRGEGTFEGQWEHGNQVSGVYRWPNGVQYSGTWEDNARHGMGVETRTDGTEYSGEFTRGTRGLFGVARLPNGVYQGQWANGAQDGEGVEMYRDHGCYRGQYRKGLRSGYGTRTSAAYESIPDNPDIPMSSSEPSLQSILSWPSGDSPHGSLKRATLIQGQTDSSSSLKTNHPTSLQTNPTRGLSLGQSGLKDELAQVYEGEWSNDKRQGYGVLKVLTKYTYYGQWTKNTITGYGVMTYENGTKQEGEWHNGTLIAVVKRHKVLLFKTHQLEAKVKEAHTKALQAAETARHKAELAKSRAASALTKSRAAAKVAEKAKGHAKLAVEKAETYKSVPRISESLKSPMSSQPLEFPSIDPEHSPDSLSMLRTGSSTNSSRLSVNTALVPSSSFDDLHSLHSDSGLPQGEGSDSPGSVRRQSHHLREERFRRMLDQYGSSSNQSFDSVDFKKSRRRISDSVMGHGSIRKQKLMRSFSLSDHEEEGESGGETRGERSLRHRIDKRTGEVDQEEVSGDESPDKPLSMGGGVRGGAKSTASTDAVTLDLLNQMAKWNRMVAMLNFGLLVLLLFLILLVFAAMYYYRLLSYYQNHPDPEEQSSPRGFLTPLA